MKLWCKWAHPPSTSLGKTGREYAAPKADASEFQYDLTQRVCNLKVKYRTFNPTKRERYPPDSPIIAPVMESGIHVGLRNPILGVRLSSGAPNFRSQSVHGRIHACHA